MKILVTGAAGFIGYHASLRLLKNKNYKIYGIDNINNYYDIKLKKKRITELKKNKKFNFYKIDISNFKKLILNFRINKYDVVINLAAQAGVRNSIDNPDEYFKANIHGFYNILECSRIYKIKHLVFASTSSVYGNNKSFPLIEDQKTDKPLSFYAATKKSNEIMAYSYSYIHKIPITGLRFFTVYGPLGRPDMSLYKFTQSMVENKKILLFNKGNHVRDFTYIDDVINYIEKIIIITPKNKTSPFNIFNISSNNPTSLKTFVMLIEKNLRIKSKKIYKGLQLGDVYKTHGNNNKIKKITKIKKFTKIEEGIKNFTQWYLNYIKK